MAPHCNIPTATDSHLANKDNTTMQTTRLVDFDLQDILTQLLDPQDSEDGVVDDSAFDATKLSIVWF